MVVIGRPKEVLTYYSGTGLMYSRGERDSEVGVRSPSSTADFPASLASHITSLSLMSSPRKMAVVRMK